MTGQQTSPTESSAARPLPPNGPGAAALLAAGVGALVLAVLAIVADHITLFKTAMIFYKPTGPLSGVTTSAVMLWLIIWVALHARWRKRTVALARISTVTFVLLLLSVLLTFPPVADLF